MCHGCSLCGDQLSQDPHVNKREDAFSAISSRKEKERRQLVGLLWGLKSGRKACLFPFCPSFGIPLCGSSFPHPHSLTVPQSGPPSILLQHNKSSQVQMPNFPSPAVTESPQSELCFILTARLMSTSTLTQADLCLPLWE